MLAIGIAAESDSEATLVCALGDRVLVRVAEWLDGQLDVGRRWTGLGQDPCIHVHHVHELARARGVAKHGHFDGEPGAPDAMMIRNLFALFADEDAPPTIVVVARDTDEDLDRIAGFQQAVRDAQWPFIAVSAYAHPEREGWLLAAFEPSNDQERAALSLLRQELGFDPTASPEGLKSGRDQARRNAKRILAALCTHREAQDRLLSVPLERLQERGTTCGLTTYLVDLRAAVAPHLGSGKP